MSETGEEKSAKVTGSDEEEGQEATSSLTDQEKSEGWMDILENGQLLKRVLEAGDTSTSRPERGCKVTIRVTTRIKSTGEVVESETYDRLEAFVGDYDVMHGLDLLLPLMHQQEVAQVVIHERFAYGSAGKEPDIPGNCTLDCEIQLLAIQWMDSESQLLLPDRIKYGTYNASTSPPNHLILTHGLLQFHAERIRHQADSPAESGSEKEREKGIQMQPRSG